MDITRIADGEIDVRSTKCCRAHAAARAATFYACHVDGQQCPIIALVGDVEHQTVRETLDCLPCCRCRQAGRDMKALTGVRLGRHERRLLLAAAVPDAKDGELVDALNESRAEQSAVSRAARKLEKVGLARLGQKKIRAEKPHPLYRGTVQRSTVVRRVAWLTPLGAAIVDRYRPQLETGKPIRWAAHATECVEAATQETPRELLIRYRDDVRDYLGFLGWQLGLVAFAGNRDTKSGKELYGQAKRVDGLASAIERVVGVDVSQAGPAAPSRTVQLEDRARIDCTGLRKESGLIMRVFGAEK